MAHVRSLPPLLLLIGLAVGCDRPPPTDPATVLALLNAPRPPAEAAAQIARGETLYYANSCSNCHVLKGPTRGAPRLSRLYATTAKLNDGSEITRDRDYLVRSLIRPRDQIVAGYTQEMSVIYTRMAAPDAAALIAFLESLSPAAPAPEPASEPIPRPG